MVIQLRETFEVSLAALAFVRFESGVRDHVPGERALRCEHGVTELTGKLFHLQVYLFMLRQRQLRDERFAADRALEWSISWK